VGATNSHQDYRGILDDKAHAVFQGKITVRPDAQGIEGHQLNKTLLLSDDAEIDSKPELEILADDVKCSHGATAGELDETGLFYLRSRGIPEAEARQLLMTAFIAETVAHIGHDDVRAVMERLVGEWMAQ
jgi:Fe-S cluster assembly protein SufD